MESNYSKQPTIMIGLGGYGSRIANMIYAMADTEVCDLVAFSIDTDVNDLELYSDKIPMENRIILSNINTVKQMADHVADSREWLPGNAFVGNKSITEGAGQIRSISRLAFDIALQTNKIASLISKVLSVAGRSSRDHRRMRIQIITSLCGGTGSGLFIELALWLRTKIFHMYPALNVKIQGDFILPGNLSRLMSVNEKANLQANTYAALMELNAINYSVYSGRGQFKLRYSTEQDSGYVTDIPYDYCFLHDDDRPVDNWAERIANSVFERLFGFAADDINKRFVNIIRNRAVKDPDNAYGKIVSEKTEGVNEAVIAARRIFNETDTENGIHTLFVISPFRQGIRDNFKELPLELAVEDVYCPDASSCTLILMSCGIKLSKIKELRRKSGKYYISYRHIIDGLPFGITPHIDMNWHRTMNEIGESGNKPIPAEEPMPDNKPVPDEPFVFISYSSRERDIADKTKIILESNGIRCWMAPQSIPPGSDYGKEIPKAIGSCGAFVLILSRASQESPWVPKEMGSAISKGKVVIPFRIDDSLIKDPFDFMLSNSQRIEAYNRLSDAFNELVSILKKLLKQ